MGKLAKEGINSFKFFLAYSGSLAVTDDQLINGFRRSRELGALPIVSCWTPSCPFDSDLTAYSLTPQHLNAYVWIKVCLVRQVHCENADALLDAQQRVFDSGFTGPEGHFISRPAVFEVLLPPYLVAV